MHAFLTHNQKPWFVHMTLGYEIYDVTSFLTRFFNLSVFQSKKGTNRKSKTVKNREKRQHTYTVRSKVKASLIILIDFKFIRIALKVSYCGTSSPSKSNNNRITH